MKPKTKLPAFPNPEKSEFENFDSLTRAVVFKKSIARKRAENKQTATPKPKAQDRRRLPRP